MKRILFVLMALVLSQYSFAGNDKFAKKGTAGSVDTKRFPASEPEYPKYIEECRKPAIEKLKNIAQINDMEIDEGSIAVSSVDDRWYSPSKYVWFSAVVKKANGSSHVIETLVQKTFLPEKPCL